MNYLQKIIIRTLLRSIGKTYDGTGLSKTNAHNTPIHMFSDWFQQTLKAAPDQANIMTISTATSSGMPRSRLVLLKHFDEKGFVFYTNYNSQKAQELSQNPQASLNFWWESFFRQVRIEGQTEKVSAKESDQYFASRDRGSQLGAWASPQSQIITDRNFLEQNVVELEEKHRGKNVPRPPQWGGYRLVPEEIEFWQGRLNRLHDRFRYQKQSNGKWQLDRLAP
jgi:pyridoxamine 5'-phosphate oxidase